MDAKRKLKGMLARIFSDATAEESEKKELLEFTASGALSAAEIQEVVDDFVKTTWKITMADGVVTDVEKKRLREIVDVLELDRKNLPDEWTKAIAD